MCDGRSSHVRNAAHADRDSGWGARLAWGPVTVTERRPGSWGGSPNRPGMDATLLCASQLFRGCSVRLAGVFTGSFRPGWRGEKKRKKEKDQISVPLNCPGFVQPTVIVRLPL